MKAKSSVAEAGHEKLETAKEGTHLLQPLRPLRLLLILFAWLLVVLPVDALAFIPRHTFTLPSMAADPALRAESAPSLTLRLDGVYERGQVRYGFFVTQNPWSKFDPEGLSGWPMASYGAGTSRFNEKKSAE